jgi:hypothetical protein
MTRRSYRSRATGAGAVLALLTVALAACSSATEVQTQPVTRATAVPTSASEVPQGWILRRGAGFRVAIPPTWADRPDNLRAAPDAAMEVGVPFTGQRQIQPLFLGFVEREQVGTLDWREPILRAQLAAQLPKATFGDSEHVKVAGATDAITFDLLYEESAGTSVLGTPLDLTVIRQRELIVETPGLPKFGFRYAASTADFDQGLWQKLLKSLVVLPAEAEATTAAS